MDVANYELARVGKRVVEYLWDPSPRNDDPSGAPIWCLGEQYDGAVRDALNHRASGHGPEPLRSHSVSPSEPFLRDRDGADDGCSDYEVVNQSLARKPERTVDEFGWPIAFVDDFEACVWLTYRSNFPPIPRSQDRNALAAMTLAVRFRSQFGSHDGFTSDTGWGCMIRSGQSLLANTLFRLHAGRGWRRGENTILEKRWLSAFADDPRAPFSIHRFVAYGASHCGKHPGEWFGPSATTRCIQALTHEYGAAGLRVYITGDGSDVYEDAVFRIAKNSVGVFQPTLILIGIRLGIDRITPVYWEGLKAIFQMPHSVGIAGGRTRASHYFVGNQGSYFFYLDPHQTRPALQFHENPDDLTDEEVTTCHTRRLRRIHIKEMDPSMLIGFLVQSEAEWHDWRRRIPEMPGKPIVHVADNEPSLGSPPSEREDAIDEVETFDDEDELE